MKQQEIQFFDSIAPLWDEREVMSVPDKINHILSLMGIETGMSVLDLGTGTGVLIPYLLERVGKEGYGLGVDISEGMLSIAHRKCDGLARYPLFLKADFETDKIPGEFDVILLYSVYPHIENPTAVLSKLLAENLRPEGNVYIAFPSDENFINNIHGKVKAKSHQLPPAAELTEWLRQNGFNSSVVEATEGSYVIRINNMRQ